MLSWAALGEGSCQESQTVPFSRSISTKLFFFWGGAVFLVVCSMEKAMATHSNTLAWKIPWTEEPGRLQSMGSLRVGHD